MADKIYQFFVSSTYEDLKDERDSIYKAILEMKQIPAGMEYFPALNEEQMAYIKQVIDESDFYVLILQAKYGTIDKTTGISYTEQEYDYAIKQGKKVIALIHENPDDIPQRKVDKTKKLNKMFMAFREKVKIGRIVSFWKNKDELASKLKSSIFQAIDIYSKEPDAPIGWVRGDSVISKGAQQEIVALKKENQQLKEQIKNIRDSQIVTDIKIDASSITAHKSFLQNDIECIALNIQYDQIKKSKLQDTILSVETYPYLYSELDVENAELYDYYINKAMPWFCNVARTCCINIRITNPNHYAIKNINIEHSFLDSHRHESENILADDYITSPPLFQANNLNDISFTKDNEPNNKNLNPKQSMIYSHAKYFKVHHDFEMIYQLNIYAENMPNPINKEIKIQFRLKNLTIDFDDITKIIKDLETKEKFNITGVYEWVTSKLNQ